MGAHGTATTGRSPPAIRRAPPGWIETGLVAMTALVATAVLAAPQEDRTVVPAVHVGPITRERP